MRNDAGVLATRIDDGSAERPRAAFLRYTAWSVVGLLALFPPMCAAVVDAWPTASESHGQLLIVILLQSLACGAGALIAFGAGTSAGRAAEDEGESTRPRVLLGRRWGLLLPVFPVLVAIPLVLRPGPTSAQVFLTVLASCALVQVVRFPWSWGILTGLVLTGVGVVMGLDLRASAFLGILLCAILLVLRSTLWLADLVSELDRVRTAQSALAIAEERLRFARDLHDVTGRDLSAIAVKAELAGQLILREDRRALEQTQEVAQLARSSLAQTRALVRGYRETDLGTELRGTVSLLRSAGIAVEVEGRPEDVAPDAAITAAWILREAGTNALRHAQPSWVRIQLRHGFMTMANDGAGSSEAPAHGDGLRGVSERLGDHGRMSIDRSGDIFALTAHFAVADAETAEARGDGR